MKNLLALCAVALVVASDASAQTTKVASLASLSTQPSMNVFRRFSVDAAKMTTFYGDVLGLKALPPLRMPGGGSMILFQVGPGREAAGCSGGRRVRAGPIRDVTGVGSSILLPDEAVVDRALMQQEFAPHFSRRTPVGAWAGSRESMGRARGDAGAAPSVYDSMEVGLRCRSDKSSRLPRFFGSTSWRQCRHVAGRTSTPTVMARLRSSVGSVDGTLQYAELRLPTSSATRGVDARQVAGGQDDNPRHFTPYCERSGLGSDGTPTTSRNPRNRSPKALVSLRLLPNRVRSVARVRLPGEPLPPRDCAAISLPARRPSTLWNRPQVI